MNVRQIITLPDPILRQVSKPVERVDDELRALLDDMASTMYDAPGIGLAGVQIGVPLRIITIDVAKRVAREEGEEGEREEEREEEDEEKKAEKLVVVS